VLAGREHLHDRWQAAPTRHRQGDEVRTDIWALPDIEIFEQANREVLDANEKRRRNVRYYLSTLKERDAI
jgi:hypothetical protein